MALKNLQVGLIYSLFSSSGGFVGMVLIIFKQLAVCMSGSIGLDRSLQKQNLKMSFCCPPGRASREKLCPLSQIVSLLSLFLLLSAVTILLYIVTEKCSRKASSPVNFGPCAGVADCMPHLNLHQLFAYKQGCSNGEGATTNTQVTKHSTSKQETMKSSTLIVAIIILVAQAILIMGVYAAVPIENSMSCCWDIR